MPPANPELLSTASRLGFPVTPWTAVLEASGRDEATAREGLARLIAVYYQAILGYFRIKSGAAHAQDLAHDFQAKLLGSHFLAGFRPERSIRFRHFLSACLRRFWLEQQRRALAEKRGGGQIPVSLEELGPDVAVAPGADLPPADALLDQQAALALHDQAIARLEAECTTPQQTQRLAVLRPLLVFEADGESHTRLARQLAVTAGALRTALFRLRCDYYNAFRAEVAQTVQREDIDDEMRHLVLLLPEALSAPAAAAQN